jgi:steroid delta-isomerase-like uncharacterized protein
MSASESYRAAIDRFNAGDLDGYLSFYSDDVVFGGATPEPMDKQETRAFHEAFVAAFPGAQVQLIDVIDAGDRLAVRLIIHGDHRGEFLGVPATGQRAQLAITSLLTMRDGRCVERWSTADMLGLLVQLGAAPVPA